MNWPTCILLAVIALGLLYCVVVWIVNRPDRLPEKRDLMRGIIPAPEDIVVPRLPDGWQAVFPHGGEVFFPEAPYRDAVYEIEIVGECGYRYGKDLRRADAVYRADGGRFSDRHYQLMINNQGTGRYELQSKPKLRVIESDRGSHRYKFLFEGERVGISFGRASERYVHPTLGYLRARVTALPEGTPGIAWQREHERQRSKAKEETLAAAERFAALVPALSIRAQTQRNWADPEYRDKFARVHYRDLIEHQGEIREEAIQFLEEQHLVSYLKRHNPTVVTTILGRLEALLHAERIALDKALAAAEAPALPEPAAPPRERKKLTAPQVRESKVWRQQRDLGDKVALALGRVEIEQQVKTHVAEQYPHLVEDERQAITQQILEQIDGDESNGKTI